MLAAIVIILGIGIFALPTGILASGFTEELDKKKASKQQAIENKQCPNCSGHLE
tara:strand:+ start:186 stop:347 length:162 start_codon:yes stop_codon:yes gene_type:complete